ncbi:glycosyltransferase family 2 protein [Acidicapsa dinghuensis]|uniref:Glycosyltransferase family 2 protein n=1 Tax=Acidicapsa dinghuensis TaxID=2218256 RepID=A0ABW1EMB2_9BACT|nr:glycosyltransferase family 2 protein [Acidicapsa dinghuensis]
MRSSDIEVRRKPHVACIVLNWNGGRDTIECLNALSGCAYPSLTVIVVDNNSTDDSVARIRAAHPDIPLLQSGANLGFASGNNVGIRYALEQKVDYLWLLNNDTKPADNALSALVDKALSDERIGAVASVCYYANNPSMVQIWAGGRANLWIGYTPYSTQPRTDDWFHWLNGTSLLVSVKAIKNTGFLDERFFLYCEDSEFCLRLRKRGWKLAAAPTSIVLHKVSASTGGNRLLFDRYSTASTLLILQLHSPAPYLAMSLFLLVRFAKRLLRFRFKRCWSVYLGMRDYVRTLSASPNFVETRRPFLAAPATKDTQREADR